MKSAHKILARKYDGKIPSGTLKHRSDGNIKMQLNHQLLKDTVLWSYKRLTAFCRHF
jgi:hypothetical protein